MENSELGNQKKYKEEVSKIVEFFVDNFDLNKKNFNFIYLLLRIIGKHYQNLKIGLLGENNTTIQFGKLRDMDTHYCTPFLKDHIRKYLKNFMEMCKKGGNILEKDRNYFDKKYEEYVTIKRKYIETTITKSYSTFKTSCCVKNPLKDDSCLTGFIKLFSDIPHYLALKSCLLSKKQKKSLRSIIEEIIDEEMDGEIDINEKEKYINLIVENCDNFINFEEKSYKDDEEASYISIEAINHPKLTIEEWEEIVAEMQEIYFQILVSKNKKNTYKNIGRLIWWIAQTMPFQRGTAAIIEILLQILLKYKGYTTPIVFRKNIKIDLEAMTIPNIENFARKFSQSVSNLENNESSDFFLKSNIIKR